MPSRRIQTNSKGSAVPAGGRGHKTPRGRLWLGTLLVAAAIGGTALAIRRSTSGGAVPVIAHVHGLGINPADGSLQIATHTGMFRLSDQGPPARVGRTAQDTMGFTVVGANHFLGSGHPDAVGFRQGKPPRLGLIESTDAGATWLDRSLSGEVDFHAIAVSQGTTYGHDAGTNKLLASNDNTSWETRSTIKALDFAVDPAQPAHLVAAGIDGALVSSDGGRSWLPITVAPGFTALSWAPGGTLWGVDGGGGSYQSTDGGTTWQAAGRIDGEPEALVAADDRLVVAVADPQGGTSIYQSNNAGRTWQIRHRSPA